MRLNQYEKNRDDGAGYLYTYGLQGRVCNITGPDGNLLQKNIYDRAGVYCARQTVQILELSTLTDPTGEKELYTYDKEGHIPEKTDRNGITTQYAFNMYGAPLYRRVKDGTEAESYQYTPEGFMKAAISAGMHYTYEYDPMGRIIRKSASGRTLLAYGYDLNGNLTY